MPEYLAPGVYIEEFDSTSTPIPGVDTSIDDVTAQALVESVRRIVGIPAAWSDSNPSDPGITLIGLCAWLAESVVYRAGAMSEARRDAALRAFSRLTRVPCAAVHGPLVRPHFFEGRLLDAATLQAEQEYQRNKLRLHNRALHGWGIVSGLNVRAAGEEDRVVVDPGYAIDPCGNELAICEPVRLRLPAGATEAFVSLRSWERPCDPMPSANGTEPANVEEASIVALSARVPPSAIALARLVKGEDEWLVDTGTAVRKLASLHPG
jgi:hypothetical protein